MKYDTRMFMYNLEARLYKIERQNTNIIVDNGIQFYRLYEVCIHVFIYGKEKKRRVISR